MDSFSEPEVRQEVIFGKRVGHGLGRFTEAASIQGLCQGIFKGVHEFHGLDSGNAQIAR